jgi:hypothetical protein
MSIVVSLALLILFFLCVTKNAYYEICTECDGRRISVENRVFGIIVSQRYHSEEESFLARLAKDIGVCCPHHYVRMQVMRLNGLFIPTLSKHVPLTLFPVVAPEWYNKHSETIIPKMKAAHPLLHREYQNALMQHDHEYIKHLIEEMHAMCNNSEKNDKSNY